MKLIHVLNHFLPFQIAGTEVYVWALCKHLRPLGYQSKVIIPNYGSTVNETYTYDELIVLRYAEPTVQDRALIMGRKLPEGLRSFKQILDAEKPDIIHFHEYSTGNGIVREHIRVAKQTGAKIVMTFHLAAYTCRTGTLVYRSETLCEGKIDIRKCSSCYLHSRGLNKISSLLLPLSRAVGKLNIDTAAWNNRLGTALATTKMMIQYKEDFTTLSNDLDAFISLTKWYKDVLLSNGINKDKVAYIPQGLPLSASMEQMQTEVVPDASVRLIFIGRISAFKGLHLLIEAMRDLPPDKILLDIYGQSTDAEYEQHLRLQSQKFANISWKGSLSQPDVVPVLRQYHLLCLCSTFSEMSPLVIQEAFAAGIPVLASNVHGNSEQLEHNQNGLLFTFNCVDSIKDQLLRCINDTTLLARLKKNIPITRSFSEVASDYHSLYKRLWIQ